MKYPTRYVVRPRPPGFGETAFTFRWLAKPKLAWRARRVKAGADDRNRTGDLVLTKDALCQLSYIGEISLQSSVFSRQWKSAFAGLRAVRPCAVRFGVIAPGLPSRSRAPMFWRGEGWSGRRGSNPRPTAWKAVTLPLSYSRPRQSPTYQSPNHQSPNRLSVWWGGEGSNLRSR